MTFPTPYTVGHHVRVATGTGDRFRETVTYNPPKDAPGVPVRVIQWGAAQSAAASQDGRQQPGYDRTIVDVELYVLPDFKPGTGDLIDLPETGQYEVVGHPQDYNHGFHGWQPGNVINLRRVEG